METATVALSEDLAKYGTDSYHEAFIYITLSSRSQNV